MVILNLRERKPPIRAKATCGQMYMTAAANSSTRVSLPMALFKGSFKRISHVLGFFLDPPSGMV
jgi:hypothetical protein